MHFQLDNIMAAPWEAHNRWINNIDNNELITKMFHSITRESINSGLLNNENKLQESIEKNIIENEKNLLMKNNNI